MQEEIAIPKTFAGWKFSPIKVTMNFTITSSKKRLVCPFWSKSLSEVGACLAGTSWMWFRAPVPSSNTGNASPRNTGVCTHPGVLKYTFTHLACSWWLLERSQGKEDPWELTFNTHAGTDPYVGKIKSSNIVRYHKNRFAFALGILPALPNPSQGWCR